jgi:4-hydroxythreonine-4-phosphate dehydrogenase
MTSPAPLAVSIGEPAGIGPDLIVSLYARRHELTLPPFVVFGDADLLASRGKRLGLEVVTEVTDDLSPVEFAARFDSALPVVATGSAEDNPGTLQAENAPLVTQSISQAVSACQAGECRALVTAPIQKSALYAAGFEHPGHTEYLAELCATAQKTPTPVMMLAFEDLRAIPLTIHVPLRDVPEAITKDLIVETCAIAHQGLKSRFGLKTPRIGVLGLNPHAGESGTIGREEVDIIAPAIAALRAKGIDADGPFSADTIFYPPNWRAYDVVVAMYHDQALIPVKTLGFDAGVNITLGLPIVRTSPDHGTALSLAGTGKASVTSMLAAIRLADEMSAHNG